MKDKVIPILFFLFGGMFKKALFSNIPLPACDSEIFCQGPLLDAAQRAYIYNDSKSFVDMKLNVIPDKILSEFKRLNDSNEGKLTDDVIREFVGKYFSPPGSELLEWTPEDWLQSPQFLSKIADSSLRIWAKKLNDLWKVLGRKLVADVKENSTMYSLIPVDNPVIVPGGRFREIYYWDTFWVMKGLLLCEMTSTVRGMLSNFLSMVERFGFVPNGGRIYYKRRSQPPFLIPMFDLYMEKTDDIKFLRESIATLESEYNFWMQNRFVQIGDHVLNIYASDVNQPRPESYREDSSDIEDLTSEEGKILMTHVTSAAESGWDFSSRWAGIDYDDQKKVTLQLKTRDIIPVDLNSILAWNEKLLAKFHRRLGNDANALKYDRYYIARTNAINDILWNDTDGSYYDYQISKSMQNKRYFASNFYPLQTKCYPTTIDASTRDFRLFQQLKSLGVLDYPGGIPTSLINSGEQWDFPNAWPPLVHILIDGMRLSSSRNIQEEALKQARKWILSNYNAYNKTKAMFEKYDVSVSGGVPGSGGEYDVQVGFGWTNGVVLDLLDKYGDQLTVEESLTTSTPKV